MRSPPRNKASRVFADGSSTTSCRSFGAWPSWAMEAELDQVVAVDGDPTGGAGSTVPAGT